jgi:hypothetical protein
VTFRTGYDLAVWENTIKADVKVEPNQTESMLGLNLDLGLQPVRGL